MILKRSVIVLFALIAIFTPSDCVPTSVHSQTDVCPIDDFRSFDGTCTNPDNPRQGAVGLAQITEKKFEKTSSEIFEDHGLPSARLISNTVSVQDGEILNRRGLTEFTTYFGQFLDHNLVLTPFNHDEPQPIEIDHDDDLFDRSEDGELGFFRSVRRPVATTGNLKNVQRPENVLSSAIDLVAVYGSSEERANALRDDSKPCKLKVSGDDLLPLNTDGLENAPNTDADFFVAGDIRANEHPMLTVLHILFVREHNTICDKISPFLSGKSSDFQFQIARHINILQFQKIVYEEFIPVMMGDQPLDRYKGFKSNVNPTVSTIFSTAAYRIGHTMVGPNVTRAGPGNTEKDALPVEEMFFPKASLIQAEGVESFLRGSLTKRCQEVDPFVVDALRNFLFTNVPEDEGLDLIAINIQRGRDHALPLYTDIRKEFVGGKKVRKFSDISSDPTIQNRLSKAYQSPSDVEAWIGLMSEDHVNGASMGQTTFNIWKSEFERLRDGDRLFYMNEPLNEKIVPASVRKTDLYQDITESSASMMRNIILRNTGVRKADVPQSPFQI